MPGFRVIVPFEPVIHETLDSRGFTNIPDADLAAGTQIRGGPDGYTAELEVEADRPGTAKAAAVERVERFLAVLASWNHGFQIRIGGVRAEVIDAGGANTVGIEGHLEAVVGKANLDAEDAFLERYDDLPEYLRSCLELNYLLVMSTRPPNRWLLAATGLEALAVGTIGAQDTISNCLDADRRRQLQEAIEPAVEAVGLTKFGERVVQRVLSTTTGPVANHVDTYLQGVGIEDTSPAEINRWWRVRGAIAHGGSADIELGELNHLITVFQTALRRTAGAEPVPPPAS